MFAEFINTYGVQIMYAIITAIAGYVGIVAYISIFYKTFFILKKENK